MRQRRGAKIAVFFCRLLAGFSALALAPHSYAQSLGPFFGLDDETSTRTAEVSLVPEGFLDGLPTGELGDISVEANSLVLDADRNLIIATGNVRLSYQGYVATANRAEYNRATRNVVLIGNAIVRDEYGVVYAGDRIAVQGDLQLAFVNALRLQTPDGALVTADEAEYRDQAVALLTNGTYAPCGTCIDEKGNRIGWRVQAASVILNREEKTLELVEPTLEIAGFPPLGVPMLRIPDPTDPRAPGLRLPSVGFADEYGVGAAVPFFVPMGDSTDFWFTPHLLTRQGLMLEAETIHRFDRGQFGAIATGLYQLDRTPFLGEVGDRDWRGAVRVWSQFHPMSRWAAGFSYQTATDAAFVQDYDLDGFASTNNAFVQYLDPDTFVDLRVEEYLLSGTSITAADQAEQGVALPMAQARHMYEIPGGLGTLDLSGDLIGVWREADHTDVVNAVPFTYGYEGYKIHGTVEAMWSDRYIVPGGVVVSPHLGVRLDAADYDGASALLGASSMFNATPIAALDVRFPLMAIDGFNSHIFEPIVQIVYRGSSTSLVGITNDNAQAFVFEDTNLFSLNRFSGSDRQETGLRVNVGGQYLGNFADGSWLRATFGQSFHVAGPNAFDTPDQVNLGPSSGLDGTASYMVAGVNAYLGGGVEAAAKIELDPASFTIARAGVGTQVEVYDATIDTSYLYEAPRPALGIVDATHTVGVDVGVPLADYWTLSTGGDWDIAAGTWSRASIGAEYDDDYLSYGASYTATQDVSTLAIGHQIGLTFQLSGPEN